MRPQKKPLYRKVNTTTHGVFHRYGGDYARPHKSQNLSDDHAVLSKMARKEQRGLDYTPLFKFLLSKVGQDWTQVHSEAVSRLDREEPIFWMVAKCKEEGKPYIGYGESSYFSGLYIDEDNRLAVVDPSLSAATMKPLCACCTHTFNGKKYTQKFSLDYAE